MFGAFYFFIDASKSTKKNKGFYRIAFYNVENLFDTLNDPRIKDEEFTPQGKKRWDTKRYAEKLKKLRDVILALEESGEGPAVMGLAEVENRKVLEDLIHQKGMETAAYEIAHHDSSDPRGIVRL